jgi:hypothetical protein
MIIGIIFLLAFNACKKNSNSSASYSMQGYVNGASFNGTNALTMATSDSSLTIYGGFFTGVAISPPYIFLNICPYRGMGTYVIPTPPWGSVTQNYASIDSTDYFAFRQVSAYGTIIITAVSPSIVGSFSFTAIDSAKVYGTFTAKAP